MLSQFVRATCLTLALGATAAQADDLADFNAAAEAVAAHNRVAIGYLRTGNTDLASLELDRTRQAWGDFGKRFSGKRPDVFAGNALYVVAVTDISTRLVTADMMLNAGRPEIARQALSAIRDDFYKLRTSAGIVVLADCIYDSNAAMDALMVYDEKAVDLGTSTTGKEIGGKAAAYTAIIDRCDRVAGDAIGKDPEFRRLVDGVKASLMLIPKAIDTNDTGLLHRVLIELRAFDNLLAFRFG